MLQKNILYPILLCFAAFAHAAHAGDNAGSYSYYLVSCGTFIKHRNIIPPDANGTADAYYVAGWLSAYNRLMASNAIPEDTTLDDVMLWLEQYCSDHPLSNVDTGLFKLTEEIKPRNSSANAIWKPPVPPASKPAVAPHVPVEGLKPLPY